MSKFLLDIIPIISIKTIKCDITIIDDCCVCLEDSNCMLPCKHNMCLNCCNMLRDKICPLCRVSIAHCYVKN
jgi:hypothetical protein